MIKKNIKKLIRLLISLVLKPFVVMWFWFLRWFRHNRLLSGLNSKKIEKHSIFYLPFSYFYSLLFLIKRIWKTDFVEYALKKYDVFLKIHYSKDGLGYFDYENLSSDECLKIYRQMPSRISYYIAHSPSVLDYKDGDSFLDAGCGKGQSIKELVNRYPNSYIKGFDVSREVLKIVHIALKDNKKVCVEQGSVVDFQYLESYPAASFDHVILSHVFLFLIGASIEKTKEMRQALIDQLMRIAAKSLLIMDGDILLEKDLPEVMIEQNNRCLFKESAIPYFSKHLSKGELYAAFSSEDKAVIFRLKR